MKPGDNQNVDDFRKELRAQLGAKTRALPRYAPDDGPLSAAQVRQIKTLAPKRTTPRSIWLTLFDHRTGHASDRG
jgi:hypothetical protein